MKSVHSTTIIRILLGNKQATNIYESVECKMEIDLSILMENIIILIDQRALSIMQVTNYSPRNNSNITTFQALIIF